MFTKIFQQYRKFGHEDANFLHLVYFLGLGGLMYDQTSESRRLKFTYIFWHMGCILFPMVTTIPYIYNQLRSDSWNLPLIASALHNAGISMFLITNETLIFIFHSELTHAIEVVNANFGIEWKSKIAVPRTGPVNRSRKFDVKHRMSFVVISFFSCLSLVSLIRYFASFLLPSPKRATNDFYYWVSPVCMMENNQSYTVYTFFTLIHSTVMYWACTKATCLVVFILYSGEILCNHFHDLANTFNMESSSLFASIESINDAILANKTRQNDDARLMERSIVCQRFGKHCVTFIQNHRKMRKSIEDWRTFVQMTFLGAGICVIFVFIPSVYIILQEDLPVPFKIAVAGYMVPGDVGFFMVCSFGKMLDDSVELAEEAVYGTPWYYLSPSQRKVIHLMLCEIQQSPITFVVMKIFPISLSSFPRIMSFNYTIANAIRMFQMKYTS